MIHPVSLAHLTVIDLPPPEMIRLAASLGFDAVGLRLIRVTETTPGYPLHLDAHLLRQTVRSVQESGIKVQDIEFVRMTPDFIVEEYAAFLDAGAELGANQVICAPYDPDLSRLAENLAAFHEAARTRGLSCVLEFFPWTNVPDLATALQVVQDSGSPDLGVLVDTLHFNRSGSVLEDLPRLGPERMPFLHLCDARVSPPYSTEDLLHAGRAERLPPGEGEIDLRAILARLPADLPLSLEVPMTALAREKGPAEVAARVLAATRRLLGQGAA